MIVCPNCRHQEISGALFCSECGTLLEGMSGIATQTINRSPTVQFPQKVDATPPSVPPPELEYAVALCVMDSGFIFPLEDKDEFTLGRSAEGQPILPDIDLAPHKAYEYGVSRLHASVRFEGNQILASDLGSVNGTRLNGQRIPPHKPYLLHHGDILALGKLKLQVLIRGENSEN
jgi:hypothetical protein